MTARKKVILGLFVLGAAALLLVVGALFVESIGVRSVESGDTISELARDVWAHQPWVVLLVTNILMFLLGWFFAHWFAAPKAEYDAIRLRSMPRERLLEALRQIEAANVP